MPSLRFLEPVLHSRNVVRKEINTSLKPTLLFDCPTGCRPAVFVLSVSVPSVTGITREGVDLQPQDEDSLQKVLNSQLFYPVPRNIGR